MLAGRIAVLHCGEIARGILGLIFGRFTRKYAKCKSPCSVGCGFKSGCSLRLLTYYENAQAIEVATHPCSDNRAADLDQPGIMVPQVNIAD